MCRAPYAVHEMSCVSCGVSNVALFAWRTCNVLFYVCNVWCCVSCVSWEAVYLVPYMECGVSEVVCGTWYVMFHGLGLVWGVVCLEL